MGSRVKLFIEIALALVFAGACGLALVAPDWLEGLFGAHLDAGHGEFERALAGGAGAAALICSLVARGEWRRARRVAGEVSHVR
ncbi:MAG TPA: hypothetical protein VKQ54_13210 [Caulobacteraceae bacterium]|nr:hypothetical protein [Caulobacteraceae bacterium]